MPDTNTETVAEHALALYFAVKRDVVRMHEWTMRGGEWGRLGTGIGGMNTFEGGGARGCSSEVVGIIGGGKIGRGLSFPFLLLLGAFLSVPRRIPSHLLIASASRSPK